ncbi:hypothetical protein KBX06_24300 [Micromonospora sp. C31]|uniref:hypothetical protein n=1 Tax=Micromonospora sp. C31 TaxID=2824876 RepID=UPI001B399011|nr:hypothetical protein [Micromonospora sp. C31]MBQ1076254.1 hypothetical protein [Micromonospora sp. C31]
MSARKPPPERKLKAGEVVHLTPAASPQFTKPIFVRLIREIPERHPPYGWLWFEGYSTRPAPPWRSLHWATPVL